MPHTNINQDEIQKFDSADSEWWKPTGAFKTLHDINPLRIRFITQTTHLQQCKVIDVGCGGGILAEALCKQGAEVTGIDASAKAISAAKNHASENGLVIDYQQITAEEMVENQAERFDIVTCMELLEHVPDPLSIVKSCAALVKPGGHVFFSTINRTSQSFLYAILAAEYIFKLLPKGIHAYEKFIRPSELASWIRQSNLELKASLGITYNPITKQYSLSKKLAVNYMLHCQRP